MPSQPFTWVVESDPPTATPEEILTAVERWARARDLWEAGKAAPCGVYITGNQVIVTRHGAIRAVDPATALAWALCVDAGATVDVGRCPACEGDGVQHWGKLNPDAGWPDDRKEGWLTRGGPQWCSHRACPECPPAPKKAARVRGVHAGTGRDTREAARLVLDAAEAAAEWGRYGAHVLAMRLDGPALAEVLRLHDALEIRVVDELAGTPASHAVAHWLSLWTRGDLRETRAAVGALTAAWERLTVPCGWCEETGEIRRSHYTLSGARSHQSGPPVDCPDCDGHGRVMPFAPPVVPCDYCDETGVVTEYEGDDGRPVVLAGPGLQGGERRTCPECGGRGSLTGPRAHRELQRPREAAVHNTQQYC